MYFIPLNQAESVALMIHALRIAGGRADCSTCPVRKVCQQQCLAIADGVERLWQEGHLPSDEPDPEPPPAPEPPPEKPRLRVVK